MSADLFAVFGTPDEAPTKQQLDERWSSNQGGPVPKVSSEARQPSTNPSNILFDAEEAEAELEDDFGDFEDVVAVDKSIVEPQSALKQTPNGPTTSSISKQVDLLDLGDDDLPEQVHEHRPGPSLEATPAPITINEAEEWGDFEDLPQDTQQPEPVSVLPNRSAQPSALTAVQQPKLSTSTDNGDGWDDFEEWNTEQASTQNQNTTTTSNQHPEIPNEPRPTNIPPPTILLQLLPTVFQSIQEEARSTSSSTSLNETAASIVTVFAVSARLLAGRSLRYKRDVYLSQSTRIGPSSAGSRSGGMKLTALDRSEALRSEREAADVCDAWARATHVFAGVVSRSEHRRPWMNLHLKMAVRAGPGFGTLEAKESCALCGIKREERIAGVDFDVDDVFDEYWVEWWGHADCRVFWYTYRTMLDQR